MLREHLEQEFCAVFSGPDGPMGGNASMYLQIPTLFNKDIHLCCIYTQQSYQSHEQDALG